MSSIRVHPPFSSESTGDQARQPRGLSDPLSLKDLGRNFLSTPVKKLCQRGSKLGLARLRDNRGFQCPSNPLVHEGRRG